MIFLLAPVIACVAYLVLTCLYNLFLHPLRKVPGPFAARLSDLWKLQGNLQGRKAHHIHAAHKRYGPIVRFAPNELSFANPAAVRDIYNSDHFVKEERFYFAKRIFHENHLMSTRNVEAHKQRKKLLQRGFSQASMLEFEPRLTDKIKTLCDKWASLCRSEPHAAIDVYPWVYWLSFDTVYHLMFDQDPGSVQKGKAHGVVRYMRAWRPTFIYKEFVPQLEHWGPYVPGYIGGYFRDVQTWKQFAVSLIRDCRAHGVKTPFLQAALEGTDQALGRPLTDSELAEEAMGGMFGGSGTTANTFIYLLWTIRSRPDIVEKLHDELKAAFPGDLKEVPSATDCAKLPYLQAVINETLRRDPTIIATLPRSAVCDTNVAGFVIPKGTVVGTQNYTIHRNEEAFPEPESFQPERWLDKEGDERRKEAFTPFSIGRRSCIGINLAKMELSKMTAAFFLRFKAEIDPAVTEAEMEMFDQFSASPVGGRLLVRMQEREG